MVTVRVKGKGWVTERHVTEGPVACISTTTKDKLTVDDETRHLSVWTDDSPEQTKRILKAQLHKKENLTDDELKVWHTIQTFLAKRAKLPIEFKGWIKEVVEDVWTGDVRVRRYFPAFMEACKVICLLRSFRRDEDLIEQEGRLEISFSDYAITSLIFDEALSQSLSYMDDQDREVQKAVARVVDRKKGVGCDGDELAREMKISTGTAYKLLRDAQGRGSLKRANKPNKGNKKLYVPGDGTQLLPDPGDIFQKIGQTASVLKIIHPVTGDVVQFRRGGK